MKSMNNNGEKGENEQDYILSPIKSSEGIFLIAENLQANNQRMLMLMELITSLGKACGYLSK